MDDNAVGIIAIMLQLMLMVMSDHNVIGLMAQLMVGGVVLYKKAVLVRFLRITDHLLSRFLVAYCYAIFLCYMGN